MISTIIAELLCVVRRVFAGACIPLLLCLVPLQSQATIGQPGTLDLTFGVGGKITTPLSDATFWVNAIKEQVDGKLVLAGECTDATAFDMCVERRLANGALDFSFNSSGKAVVSMGAPYIGSKAIALVIQPDGKILIAGTCHLETATAFCAARLHTNGATDGSFGASGKIFISIASEFNSATGMALQPDGKVVISGTCGIGGSYGFCAARFTANGALDVANFGSGGSVVTGMAGVNDFASAMLLQPDGKIVLAGTCDRQNPLLGIHEFCALRYTASGQLDTTFGTSGRSYVLLSVQAGALYGAALQTDGKIVLVGDCREVSQVDDDVCTLRLQANGALDAAFGTAGFMRTGLSAGSFDTPKSIAVLPSGKILVAGYRGLVGPGIVDFFDDFIVRYQADGSLDTSFGTGGKLLLSVDGNDFAATLAVQRDGRFLLAGYCDHDLHDIAYSFCAARLDGDLSALDVDGNGTPDAATDGVLIARYLFGFRGTALTANALGPNPTRTGTQIETYLAGKTTGASAAFKVTAGSTVQATSDGLVIMRFLSGITGDALTAGLPLHLTHDTGVKVGLYLGGLPP